jgi:hypothetical protein
MYEHPWCSANQFVPLRIKSNMKGVKPHNPNYGFEILIDLRTEPSMSNVVQKGYFCYSASQPNLLHNYTMKEIVLNLLGIKLFPKVWRILVTFVVL